ncbi:hypothetical protein TNCV_2709501 [Trichonephila clavipes]|nr:hypothetical protein TNCV_2709501 [Trichonephila clavipes]
MVAKGFGGKNFPILNKGNQVARCEGGIGVPNRGPRAVKGWSQAWNIPKMQIVGELGDDGWNGDDSMSVMFLYLRSFTQETVDSMGEARLEMTDSKQL